MANNGEPSLDDLATFLAVCTSGGFRAAARQLGLSPAYVSETVARLEAQLGVPLLTRTTRNVAATETGRALAERLGPLLAETRSALQDVADAQHQVQGLLKLSVPGAVTVDILPPLIDRFLVTHPKVRIEIVVEDRFVDLATAGCDAGIRYSEHLAQDVVAVPIGPRIQQVALAAAPSYLAERGMPAHPRDLLQHTCIRLRFSSGAMVAWELEHDGEAVTVDPPSRLIIGVDAAAAAIDLARRGHGIIGTFRNWLDPDLASGALRPVLAPWWQRFDGPRLYFARKRVSAPLRAFIDFVTADAKASPGGSSPDS